MKLTTLLTYILRISLFLSACLLLILFDSWVLGLAIFPVLVVEYCISIQKNPDGSKRKGSLLMGLLVVLLVVQMIVFAILGIKIILHEEEESYFLESLNGPDREFMEDVKTSYSDISAGNIAAGVKTLRYSASKAIMHQAKTVHHSLGVVDKAVSQYLHVTSLISLFGESSAGHLLSGVPPDSAQLIRSVFGALPNTSFPDLQMYSSATVRTNLAKIFTELPADGFSKKYLNPCWEREGEKDDDDDEVTKAPAVKEKKKTGSSSSGSSESADNHLHCLPAVYLLGQPKSGTSDLYSRLTQHHDIHSPSRKEIRWFTQGEFYSGPYRPRDLKDKETSIFEYTNFFDKVIPSIQDNPGRAVTLDGGPHTFWWPLQAPDGSEAPPNQIPPAQIIREITPHAKFLVTLSNPVSRMYSDYYFLNDDRRVAGGSHRPPRGRLRGSAGRQKLRGGHDKDKDEDAEDSLESEKSPEIFHERAVAQVKNFRMCVTNNMNHSIYLPPLSDPSAHGEAGLQAGSAVSAAFKAFLNAEVMANNADGDMKKLGPDQQQAVVGRWFRAAQICAHDRHAFGVAGWGRLSIGLYSLYYEKWLEHFSPSQFKLVRLEDYEASPKEYLKDIFSFLQVDMPVDDEEWSDIITLPIQNKHRQERLPMLPETKELLEKFYRPYNILLAKALKDRRFMWGQSATTVPGANTTDTDTGTQRQHHDAHGPEGLLARLEKEAEEEEAKHDQRGADHDNIRISQRHDALKKQYYFTSKAFSIDGLKQPEKLPTDEKEEFNEFVREIVTRKSGEWVKQDFDDGIRELCAASFGLDFAALKYLLWEVGVPSTVAELRDNLTPLHCLASVYIMSEASAKSVLFSMLKGVDSWLTPAISSAMPKYAKSIRSMDIVETLGPLTVQVAEWLIAAGANVNATTKEEKLTPLHVASKGGMLPLVEFLLGHGADPNVFDSQYRSPLVLALAYGHAEVAALLAKYGALMGQREIHGVNPRSLIAARGVISAADALKYFNVVQDAPKKIDRPLHPVYASSEGAGVQENGGWSRARLEGYEEDLGCDIDQHDIEEISAVDLFEKYIAHQRPVLLRAAKVMSKWPAMRHYSRDTLMAEHGSEVVTVSSIPYSTKFGGAPDEQLTIEEYIKEMMYHNVSGGKYPWYVFKGNPIDRVNHLHSDLNKSDTREQSLVDFELIPTPATIAQAFHFLNQAENYDSQLARSEEQDKSFISDEKVIHSRKDFVNAQWALGGAGTGAPIHFHNTAWNALVYGAKKWFMYPPHDAVMSNMQIREYTETEMKEFEKRTNFKAFKPLSCVQTSGDIMIVPESWGHGVLNIQDSIAVATESRGSMWRLKMPLPFTTQLNKLSPNRKPPMSQKRRKEHQSERVKANHMELERGA